MEEENDINIMDCDVYTYNLVHGLYNEEDEEQKKSYHIYKCINCGFVFHTGQPPIITDGKEAQRESMRKQLKENSNEFDSPKLDLSEYTLKSDPTKFRCPVCSRIVPFTEISEDEYKKAIERKRKYEEKRKQRQERKKIERQERAFRINIYKFNSELKDITKELSESLSKKEISPQRFVSLYRNLSFRLFNKYKNILNNYGLDLDFIEFKKISESLSDDVLKFNKVQEKTEDILENEEKEIENDPVYIVLNKKHIVDIPIYLDDSSKDELIENIDDEDEEKYWIAKHEAYTDKVNNYKKEEKIEHEKIEKERKIAQEKRKNMLDNKMKSITYKTKK